MGQVSPLPPPREGVPIDAPPAASPGPSPVRTIVATRCALCGAHLEEGTQRFTVISPRSAERVLTVCGACRKAVLSEGYRPAG